MIGLECVQLTFRQKHDVVKEMVGLGSGLQQRNQNGSLLDVGEVSKGAHDLEGGVAVQPRTDLI